MRTGRLADDGAALLPATPNALRESLAGSDVWEIADGGKTRAAGACDREKQREFPRKKPSQRVA